MLLELMLLAKTYNNGSEFVTAVCKTLLIYLYGYFVYNDCRHVSTYCDTDKRNAGDCTKVFP